jgi:hypothetical protein
MGDSYGWALVKYMAESFGRLTWASTRTLDMNFLASEQPDVVVSLLAERYLIKVPVDENARSVATQEARKLAMGSKRARVPFWDLAEAPSIS